MLVAVSIFVWFAIVQPALVGGNLIAASVTWLVVLCAGLYVAGRVLLAIRRAQPTLITPWTDPFSGAMTDDAAALTEADAAKQKEALQPEVKLDDDNDVNDGGSGDHGPSLDGDVDVDVDVSGSHARSAWDTVARRSSDASSWSLDAASWSNVSRSDCSADGIADGDVDGDGDEAHNDDGSEDGRDSPVSTDSQQWAALLASTSHSSGSAAASRRHHHQPSSSSPAASLRTSGSDPSAVVARHWSLSQSDDEGGGDPNALLFDDDWDTDDVADDGADDDVDDAPLHRTPTGKASASGVVSSRFVFESDRP